jgi:hypothetical protein
MKKRVKLTQEQLKAVLQGWKTTLLACCVWDIGDYFSDEHVYTQIEELIEDSDTAAWMDRCHELELEMMALKQRPTVTREWVGDLGDLFFDLEHSCEEPVDRSTGRKSGSEAREDIRRAFAEIGVEIAD